LDWGQRDGAAKDSLYLAQCQLYLADTLRRQEMYADAEVIYGGATQAIEECMRQDMGTRGGQASVQRSIPVFLHTDRIVVYSMYFLDTPSSNYGFDTC